jgi:hypothetical protein
MNYSIDRDTYKIEKNNYYNEIFNKSLIILGSTNRAKNNHLIRLLNKKYTKEWNTYTITRDGIIYEHYNPLYYSDFMKDNIVDRKSVSILLENMGHLYYNSDTNYYVNDLNEIYIDKPYEKEWRGYKTYEPYTKEQYGATVFLCRSLCLELNINDDTFGHNALEDMVKNYNGIISRSNYDVNCTDLNPSFDFRKFLKDLKK